MEKRNAFLTFGRRSCEIVIVSSLWDNGTAVGTGAVTWGSGTTGVQGVVSAANNLVGSTTGDYVGNIGITVLSNSNYLVLSSDWNKVSSNGGTLVTPHAAAVTFGNSATGGQWTDYQCQQRYGSEPILE